VGNDWQSAFHAAAAQLSEIVHARVEERLVKLYLKAVAQRLDAILSQAARTEPTYLDFLDQVLGEETEAKQRKRVTIGRRPSQNGSISFSGSLDEIGVAALVAVRSLSSVCARPGATCKTTSNTIVKLEVPSPLSAQLIFSTAG